MAFARVTGFVSISLAVSLALLLPDTQGAAYAGLAGWTGVVLLGIGIVFGEKTPIVVASAVFVVKVAILATLAGQLYPPIWVQALILVLMVETAALSIDSRVVPRPMISSLGRLASSGLLAMIVSIGLEAIVYGTTGSGMALRVSAVAAAIFLVGWLTMTWRRATT